MTAETVLMWSAAAILAAFALAALTLAVWFAASAVKEYANRHRVRGLTRAQIGEVKRYAQQLRYENGTTAGRRSPPVDPVNQPKWHPDD